jgi:hypothetical protein
VLGTSGGGIWGDWGQVAAESVYRYPVFAQGWGALKVTATVSNGTGQLVSEFFPVGATTPADTHTITKACN